MEKYQIIIIRLVVIIGVLLALFLVAVTLGAVKSYKYIGSGTSASNVITVQGHGEVEKAPDTAKFSFTVQDEQSDTAVAQANVSKKVDQVKNDLIAAGVEEKYITTDTYNSYPDYQFNDVKCTTTPCPSQRTLKGYIVSQEVKVSVKDLAKVEIVTGILGKDGVTSIYGPNLGFEDSHEVSNEARDKAIADAKTQADKLAQALGVKIVRIVSFNENGGGGVSPVAYGSKAMAPQAMDVSAPSVPTGVQTVTSDVSITYEIR